MKVVMAWSHGADVPALRAAYPGIEIVEVERASLVDVIGDADVVYGGGLTGAELRGGASAEVDPFARGRCGVGPRLRWPGRFRCHGDEYAWCACPDDCRAHLRDASLLHSGARTPD